MLQPIINKLAWPELKESILNYNFTTFKSDFLAGMLVAAVGFPSVMAFAMLAGLNPVYGLYSFIVAAIVGTFVGVSRYLVMGPTSIIAPMIASSLGALAITGPDKLGAVLLLTFMVGVIQVILSFLNFGGISNYISRSVISGLITGVAFIIAAGQLVKLLGVEVAQNGNAILSLYHIGANLGNINPYTFLVGFSTLLIILIIKKLIPKAPAYLVGIVFSVALVYFGGLESQINMVTSLESSFSGLTAPLLDLELAGKLFSYAFAIAILGFVDVVTITEFNGKGAIEQEQVNKELCGLGIMNMTCSFFNGFAGGGSFSRSFTNYDAGAKTRFSQLIAGIFVLLFLIFFGHIIEFFPMASLGAILIVVAFQMVDLEEIQTILTTKRFDGLVFAATFGATILIPRLDYAVYLGILFSLFLLLKDTSDLNYSYLKIEGQEVNQKNLKEMTDEDPIVIDLSGTLHFNTVDKLEKELEEARQIGDSFIIRMRNVEEIDLTTISQLEEFIDRVRSKGGDVFFAGISEKMKKDFQECGLKDKLGEENFFSKDEALFSSSKTALKEAQEKSESEEQDN